MPQVSVNIRMDRELKKEFESFCSEMGMSMTTAFTIFAKKQSVKRGFHLKSALNIQTDSS